MENANVSNIDKGFYNWVCSSWQTQAEEVREALSILPELRESIRFSPTWAKLDAHYEALDCVQRFVEDAVNAGMLGTVAETWQQASQVNFSQEWEWHFEQGSHLHEQEWEREFELRFPLRKEENWVNYLKMGLGFPSKSQARMRLNQCTYSVR